MARRRRGGNQLRSAWLGLGATAALLAGCPRTPGPVGPTGLSAAGPELSTFSETHPVTSLSIAQGALFTTTDAAIHRFDLKSGDHARVTGLLGSKVYAVAADSSSLWAATDAGLQRRQQTSWTTVAPAGPQIESTQVMLATAAGVWLGGTRGLWFHGSGGAKSYLPGARVTVLLPDLQGDGIWVGTEGEGVYRFDGASFSSHSPAQGQTIRRVRSLGWSGEGGLIATGLGEGGDALAFYDGSHWSSYRFEPAGQVRWAMQIGGELLVGYDARVLALTRLALGAKPEDVPPGPVKVIGKASPRAPANYPLPAFTTRIIDPFRLPTPVSVLAHGGAVWLATGPSGVASFDGKAVRWYRTRELTGTGERLKVACAPGPGLCYLAGGGGRAYAFDGRVFVPVVVDKEAPNQTVQAFVNDAAGGVIAILSPEAGQSLIVARLQGSQFVRQQEIKVTIPSGKLGVRFVRVDSGGRLWLGLEHGDAPATRPAAEGEKEAEPHPWGVAVVEPGGASALYHRSTLVPTEDRPPGSLALPDDIRDVLFASENWYATANGICRVRGAKVDLFTENEGLESEIVYALGRSARGQILAATHAGLGRYDGKYWRFDAEGPLRTPTRALLTRGESVFVGTSRGLVEWREGKIVRVIDVKAGLAGDEVRDLYLEGDRRLWVLTHQGLSILTL